MDPPVDAKLHGHSGAPAAPGRSSPTSGNGKALGSNADSGSGAVAGLENSLASVQLSYGSVGGGHPSNTGVDLNGGSVGNGMGSSGIMNQGNHGMDFGFGFSHAWGAPPIPGMHHGSPGYQLHQSQPLLNQNSISAQPPPHGSLVMSPDQAAAMASAVASNSPTMDSMSQQQSGSGDPGSTTSSVQGAPPPPPPQAHNPFNMPGMSVDPLETILGPFPCARLRGLPFEASIQDVLVFFHGLLVLDVVVSGRHDGSGRGIGEAFVVFAPVDFQIALQHNRQNMGRRYIEVFPSKRSEYYAAIASQLHMQGHANSPEGENSTHVSIASGGMWTDKGPTPAQANALMQHLHLTHHQQHPNPYFQHHQHHHPGQRHGGRYYDGRFGRGGRGGRHPNSRSHQQQWQNGHTSNGAAPNTTIGGPNVPTVEREHTGFLRMRGLPFSATKENIMDFFKEFPPDEESVVFSYRTDGRATGEAYAQFSSADESKAAMTNLNRNMMGTRYIELFVSSNEEHRRMSNRASTR